MESARSFSLDRKLCRVEWGLWKFDQAAPLNLFVAVRVRGPLTEAALREGLSALRARHPLLRSRIQVDGSGWPWFRFDAVGPIPLRVVHAGLDAVRLEVERELNDKMKWEQGLARAAVVMHAPEDATLILVMHHAISDGKSSILAMRDLVQASSRAVRGLTPDLAPLDDVRHVEQHSAGRILSKQGLRLVGELVLEEARLRVKHGDPFQVPRDREVPVHGRQFRYMPQHLDEALTATLVARAKKERVSVHAALAAAMLLGTLQEAGVKEPAHVAIVNTVDVRTALVPAIRDDIGYYVSTIPYRGAVDPSVPFWDLARTIFQRVSHGVSRGDAPMMLGLLDGFTQLLRGRSASPVEYAERWAKAIVNSMMLSNVGRVELDFDSAPLSVETLCEGAALSALGDFASVTSTFRGRLDWSFVWADPVIDARRAERLVDVIMKRLEQALSPEQPVSTQATQIGTPCV